MAYQILWLLRYHGSSHFGPHIAIDHLLRSILFTGTPVLLCALLIVGYVCLAPAGSPMDRGLCTPVRRVKKMKILILNFYHPYFHVKSYYKNFGLNNFFQKLRFPLRFCRLKSLSPLYEAEKKVLQSKPCGYSKLVYQGPLSDAKD